MFLTENWKNDQNDTFKKYKGSEWNETTVKLNEIKVSLNLNLL